MTVKLTFHGACGIVTGSCFEVRTDRGAVLIDCGLFQGTKSVKQLNYESFQFPIKDITALILTHAHLDHCGLAPKLRNAGFKAPIFATQPTADLLAYVLPDSGYVQEYEVMRLNRRNRRRGRREVEPIYVREDGERCAKSIKTRPLNKWFDVAPGMRARFWDAGHILGSASVELEVDDADFSRQRPMKILFSGDIGTGRSLLQSTPTAPRDVDYLIVESTYGDRPRVRTSMAARRAALRKEIDAGLSAGGVVLIPAFAVERTQQLLFDLDSLFDTGELPSVPTFVDSPLATRATRVFSKYLDTNDEVAAAAPFERTNLRFTEDAEASRNLSRLRGGAIIIAGSGMCDAGRIRHHLKNNLSDPTATVILVGYQAPGTMGRLLSQGVTVVRIQGEEIAVKARIRKLDGYSGHADQAGLVRWVNNTLPVQQGIFLVHGEEDARRAMATALEKAGLRGRLIKQPIMGETVVLTAKGSRSERVTPRIDVATSAMADWHNKYAETIIELRQALDRAKGDKRRHRLLSELQKLLRSSQ